MMISLTNAKREMELVWNLPVEPEDCALSWTQQFVYGLADEPAAGVEPAAPAPDQGP